jgi:lysophospholipase L1-like esterase
MAVIGDSIVWGSGLSEEDKFWELVRRWLAERLGRPVNPQVLAHSLAVLEPDPEKDRKPAVWGEIRFRHPSITYEALSDPRLTDPEPPGIDLVLVDGGINDLGPLNLIAPWRSPAWVRERAAELCGRRMKALLLSMLDRFPKARVVVIGYYPLVSRYTWFVRALTPVPPLKRRVIELSTTWAQASSQWLRWAANEANQRTSSGPKPRVVYANAEFRPENCYGSPDTYLWTLWEAFTDRSELGKRRRCECRRLKPFDFICPIDKAFHPNRKGARAYADAITGALDRILPVPR